jgi:N-acetyltransferase
MFGFNSDQMNDLKSVTISNSATQILLVTTTVFVSKMSTEKRKTYLKRVRSVADTVVTVPMSPKKTLKRRRDDEENNPSLDDALPVLKRRKTFKSVFESTKKPLKADKKAEAGAVKPLRQLTLALSSRPSMISCNLCALSYTRGAPEDEALHKSHCARVLRGSEWSREDEREAGRSDACSVVSMCELSSGQSGRIISIRANAGGRLGTKVCCSTGT